MNRRDFLARVGVGLTVLPAVSRAATTDPGAAADRLRIGATWRGSSTDSRYRAGVLVADRERGALRIGWSVELPARAHGLLAERDGGLLVVAVRPGRWLLRIDPQGQVVRNFQLDDAAGSRRFNGHVVASPDGTRLYTTETDAATGAGWITFTRLAEWPTHGIEPHDIVVDREGQLVVANGGILRTPDDRKRDLDRMDSSLVRLHAETGEVLGQWRAPDPRLSLRHLAWSPAGGDAAALLGIAMQAEHDDPARRAEAPVLAVWDGRELRVPSYAVDGAGYAGDIAPAVQGGFVVSNNAAGRALLWQPGVPARLTPVAELQQAYALCRWPDPQQPGGVLIAAARGLGLWHPVRPAALLPWPEAMVLDNHWVAMSAT